MNLSLLVHCKTGASKLAGSSSQKVGNRKKRGKKPIPQLQEILETLFNYNTNRTRYAL